MIFDTFMFNDELDMLECRLTELQDVPDLKHVVIESSTSHRGKPKLLNYVENRERFAPWKGRVRLAIAFTLPESPDPWDREPKQREYARSGLWDAKPGDAVLHGDVDEIPSTTALGMIADGRVPLDGPVVLGQRHLMYACDWEYPAPFWPGTIAVSSACQYSPVRLTAGSRLITRPGTRSSGPSNSRTSIPVARLA